MQIDAVKFGIAFGIVYGAVFFLFGVATFAGWGVEFARFLGDMYVGFGPTLPGALIGAVWGFAVGFVFFALGAWIYNILTGRSEEDR
ncbi:MAG: hypothetical protein ACE5FR_11740 [Rhodospirillales bacterium]